MFSSYIFYSTDILPEGFRFDILVLNTKFHFWK